MNMFSECSDCAICGAGGACLAGNGDNDYFPASKEQIIDRIKNNIYPSYKSQMINYLKVRFNIEWEGENND